MEVRELICIGCPLGCNLKAEIDENLQVKVSGNTCPKGEDYARKELTDPRRTITTVIPVRNGNHPVVSAKSESEVPKNMISSVMDSLKDVSVSAPIKIGQVLVENLAGTGVNLIATRNIGLEQKEGGI